MLSKRGNVMGGKKRPTISQLEKKLRRERIEKEKARKEKIKGEVRIGSVNISINEVMREVVKTSYVTPYQLASKSGIKISVARKVLKELEEKGLLKLIDKNRRIAIYVPIKR